MAIFDLRKPYFSALKIFDDMPELTHSDQEFLNQLNDKIAAHLANEQFGVTELAELMNMSRSNLLRKVKKVTHLSVSQLISKARLTRSMELLRSGTLNVSEVSAQVGFGSTSYFIKCFREYYGYPPGEVNKRLNEAEPEPLPLPPPPSFFGQKKMLLLGMLGLIIVLILGGMGYLYWFNPTETGKEKSIAVLPFKNDSNDSTNLYIMNGLMEATLNNLQKLQHLKVVSRTSSEKFRNHQLTIPEMAKELDVNYFVEGSGQKIGDRIVLTIQLIDATDRHLWSRQYRRETKDIFALQQEISKDIADEIQVLITPDERSRFEKKPTENAMAYDAFLKGIARLNNPSEMGMALNYFKEAIHHDRNFALANACAGIACYYLDVYHAEKVHLEELGNYANDAMRNDPQLSEAYVAKGMFHLLRKEYSEALPYLEKGLEYSPNSTLVLGLLADFYSNYLPNTGKYLEYALKGLRLGANSGDSVTISYFHLRLANALIQTGFVDKSLEHLNRSLEYFPGNAYSRYVRAFVIYAKNRNLQETRQLLANEFKKDTTRFDILQDIGKVSYYLSDFDSAYQCYERFNRYRERLKLDVYRHENMTIGKVYERVGQKEKAKQLINSYREYLETDQTAYKNLGYSLFYCHSGENQKAMNHLKLFAQEDNIQYWVILFLNKDPLQTATEQSAEFQKIAKEIERKFWANHERIKLRLEEKGVM